MKVWVYCVMRNEAPLLPYFLRHYLTFADRITIYDDQSDDGGPAIIQTAGPRVQLLPFPFSGLDDIIFMDFANETYKEARGQADWVIWVDADEFIYHPHILMTLGRYLASDVTLPLVAGFAMWSETFPAGAGQIYDEIKTGVPYDAYSKPVVVNPAIDIRWGAGKHGLHAGHENARRSQEAEIKLLHYRHLGEPYYTARQTRNYTRCTPANIERGLGFQTYPQHQAQNGWAPQRKFFEHMGAVI
jgi:hypothetical protein